MSHPSDAIDAGPRRANRRHASFHDQDRTVRELHNSIGAAADQTLVDRRMAGCADDEQFDLEFLGKLDDDSHRMPGDNMRMEFDIPVLGH
jgi:hypothetical protein